MHLLTTSSTGLDEIVEAVDLGQPPGDIAILSFADSDLSGLATAWEVERAVLPSVRLAHICATCAIRCRSICGLTGSAPTPK